MCYTWCSFGDLQRRSSTHLIKFSTSKNSTQNDIIIIEFRIYTRRIDLNKSHQCIHDQARTELAGYREKLDTSVYFMC